MIEVPKMHGPLTLIVDHEQIKVGKLVTSTGI